MPPARSPRSVHQLKSTLDLLLLEFVHPVLSEPGREVMDLASSRYALEIHQEKLLWHIWNERTNFVRHITGITRQAPSRLELRYQRFGKGPAGTLILTDSRASAEQVERRGVRVEYTRRLRRWLTQLFPGWKIATLTCEADWSRSLSGRYTRGLITRGQSAWAVIGTGEAEGTAPDEILTFGLLWLDQLKATAPQVIAGLKIFLPEHTVDLTLQRMAWLDREAGLFELYATGEEPLLRQPDSAGNLKTTLPTFSPPHPPSPESPLAQALQKHPGCEIQFGGDGSARLAVNGLVAARETPQGLVFGVGRAETTLTRANAREFQQLLANLVRLRRADSPDPGHPYFRLQPERWLEAIIRRDVHVIAPELERDLLYQQISGATGVERGVIDLLGISRSGRLAVMELKVSQNLHLPLQALDYWMRVNWHHRRGEFSKRGYFGGRMVSRRAPLLMLVSPALQFHPACERLLRYFSKEIEVVRIGINETWREKLRVVFREQRT